MANNKAVQHPANETEIDLISAEMEARGISKNALADNSGIPYKTLDRRLKGDHHLTFAEFRRIAAALEVPPSRLLPDDLTAASKAA